MVPTRQRRKLPYRASRVLAAIFVGACCFVLPCVARCADEPASTTVYVEVASSKVRKEPKHWAPGVADVVYGAPLSVVERNGAWLKVRTAAGAEGYIHQSAVTVHQIVLAPGSKHVQIQADNSDVVLAGKGFSGQVETEYRSQNKELPYETVDKLEKLEPTDEQVGKFIENGKLRNE